MKDGMLIEDYMNFYFHYMGHVGFWSLLASKSSTVDAMEIIE